MTSLPPTYLMRLTATRLPAPIAGGAIVLGAAAGALLSRRLRRQGEFEEMVSEASLVQGEEGLVLEVHVRDLPEPLPIVAHSELVGDAQATAAIVSQMMVSAPPLVSDEDAARPHVRFSEPDGCFVLAFACEHCGGYTVRLDVRDAEYGQYARYCAAQIATQVHIEGLCMQCQAERFERQRLSANEQKLFYKPDAHGWYLRHRTEQGITETISLDVDHLPVTGSDLEQARLRALTPPPEHLHEL